jgi:hypothetical protein
VRRPPDQAFSPAHDDSPAPSIGMRIFMASARSTPVGRATATLFGQRQRQSMRVGRRIETYPDDLGSRDHVALADRVPVKVTDVAFGASGSNASLT